MDPPDQTNEDFIGLTPTKSPESIDTSSSTALPLRPQDASVASSSSTSPNARRVFIDWTRAPVPGSPPYVEYLRSIDWAATALGPMDSWSMSLRHTLVNIMRNPDPRLIVWGPERVIVYNEAFIPVIKNKHPDALGKSVVHGFAEAYNDIAPIIDAAIFEGKSTQIKNMPLTLDRMGFLEETFWSFTLLPVIGDDGYIEGALDALSETTGSVVNDRRMGTILDIGQRTNSSGDLDTVWDGVIKGLEMNPHDVPFALLYSVGDEVDNDENAAKSTSSRASRSSRQSIQGKICRLKGLVGINDDSEVAIPSFVLAEEDNAFSTPFRTAWFKKEPVWLKKSDLTLPLALQCAIPGRAGGSETAKAVICPVFSTSAGSAVLAFLIVGISSRYLVTEEYKLFLRLLGERINVSATAVSLPFEQRQAQAAAEEAALRHASLSRQLLLRTQEAERSELKFTRMAERVPIGMFMLRTPDYSPVYLNDKYYELTGVTREEPLPWRELVHPDDAHIIEDNMNAAVENKQPATFEYRLKRPWKAIDKGNGTEMVGATWLLATLFPEVESDGAVMLVIGWLTDISLRKWTEKFQERRLEEALEMKRQKENFIDMTSHELRNPLSAIVQSADSILTMLKLRQPRNGNSLPLVSRDSFDAVVEAAEIIMLCTQHMKKIVDDILTLSKLDSHLLIIAPDLSAPKALVDKALKMFETDLHAAGINASIKIDESYEAMAIHEVVFDPSRLLQVLINLVTNAIKFTRDRPQKNITISLSASKARPASDSQFSYIPQRNFHPGPSFGAEWGEGSDVYIRFAVEDTGKGLTPEEINLLFLRFSQASPKTYANYGGSGLGLFISRELTELQGGQIGVFSKAGVGSTFAFYVKALKVEPKPPKQESSIASVLNATPLHTPGRQHVKRSNSGYPFPTLPPSLSKPSSLTCNPSIASRTVSMKTERLHVLVVEDNLINQKVMASQLRRQGCVVYIANHGVEALAFLQTTTFSAGRPPDPSLPAPWIPTPAGSPPTIIPLSVILMDVEMPVMDGLTCIRKIRQMEAEGELLGHVPVIAVTANARTEQIDIAIGHGMDSVVTKPFRIPELMPKMEALVYGLDEQESSMAISSSGVP